MLFQPLATFCVALKKNSMESVSFLSQLDDMKQLVFTAFAAFAALSLCGQTDTTFPVVVDSSAAPLYTTPTEPEASREEVKVAEQEEPKEAKPSEPKQAQISPSHSAKHGLGVNFGINGLGLDYGYMPGELIAFRARFQTLPYDIRLDNLEFSETYIGVDGEMNFTNLDLLVDFYPFKSSFKLVGGLGYFMSNRLESRGYFTDNLNFGDFELSPDELGDVTIRAEWAKWSPYLGLGFGKAVPNKRVGFGFEIGTYYGGAPDVTIIATEMLAQTSEEEAELEENLKSYAWIPYLNFRISIRLI